MADLIGRLRDDRDDAALAQVGADRAGGVGLIAEQPLRAGARTADRAGDAQLRE